MRKKLAYFVSHPIQYQAPLLKLIAEHPEIDLHVFFLSDLSTNQYQDAGFGQAIKWDTPLTEGYTHTFLTSEFKEGDFSLTNPKVKLAEVSKALKEHDWSAVWVHGYSNLALLAVIFLSLRKKIPLFFRGESNLLCSPQGLIKDIFIRFLVKKSSALLWVSSANKQYYQHYGADDKQLFFMPYAVDNQAFQAHRKSSNLNNKAVKFLFASKFIDRKNAGLLLQAFAQLPDDLRAKAELVLAGSGPLQSSLEDSVKALGISEKVEFIGFVNQAAMPDCLANCDVFVLPSEKEPFGLIVNEAMNLAKPVIVSDQVGCAEDLVVEGENGWTVKANCVNSLTRALQEAIESQTQLKEMGVASINKINSWSYAQDIEGLSSALSSLQ